MSYEPQKTISITKGQLFDYARLIIRARFKEEICSLAFLGGGSFGRVVSVSLANKEVIILKFLLLKGMMDKEIHDLALLQNHCNEAFPRVLFYEYANESVPVDYYAMTKIEGVTAMFCPWLYISKKKRKAFIDRVITAAHDIHQCKSDKFGDTMNPQYDNWFDYYKPFAKEVMESAEENFKNGGFVTKKMIETMRLAWARFDDIFSEPVTEAVLIHGDIHVANIMVTRKGEMSGIIDPFNTMYADREFDLFQFNNLNRNWKIANAYIKKYGASKMVKEKLAFYGLWNEVYCVFKNGTMIPFIMKPLVKNMNKILKKS